MFDKLIDKHKNPWSLFLHLVALVIAVYGLWNHSWTWIIIAIVVAAIGHLVPDKKGKKRKKK